MRTTLDLPEDLLQSAIEMTGLKTRTAVIIHALKELIRREKMQEIRNYRGKVDLDIDLDSLRGRS